MNMNEGLLSLALSAAKDQIGVLEEVLAERDSEIERLKVIVNDWCAEGVPVNAAIALENDQLRAELAALKAQQPVWWQFFQDGEWHNGFKHPANHRVGTEAAGFPVRDLYAGPVINAQPSGVVLDSVNESASILRNMIDSIGTHGNYSPESTLLFLNQALGCLDEVARLNSSPVSAGDEDDYAAFEAFMEINGAVNEPRVLQYMLWRHGRSAGGVDERAEFPVEAHLWPLEIGVEAQQRAADAGCERIDCLHDGVQAMLAALTAPAPNHSEQVRQMVPDGWQLVPVEPTEAMLSEIHLIESFTGKAMRARYKAMLAAAPSAGSHGGDV